MPPAIVIPAFNEADSIANVVASVRPFGTVIVVDDGSADETGVRAEKAGATIVSHGTNQGYDRAIASGLAKAGETGAETLVTFDADGQLDTSAIAAVLEAFADSDTQLVVGVRDTGAARFSEALFNFYTHLRFGVPDILCGLKGFRLDAYRSHRDRTETESVNTALALALLRDGAGYKLVPVAVKPRAGKSRYGGTLRANARILQALGKALMDDLLPRDARTASIHRPDE